MLVKFFSFGMVVYNGGGFWVKYIVKFLKKIIINVILS